MFKVKFEKDAEKKRLKRRFKNSIVQIDNITFQSKLEAVDYMSLRQREVKGDIKNLRRQVPFEIDLYVKVGERFQKFAKFVYKADFTFDIPGYKYPICYESKGRRTTMFNLKWKAVQKAFPKWEFRITPKAARNKRRR